SLQQCPSHWECVAVPHHRLHTRLLFDDFGDEACLIQCFCGAANENLSVLRHRLSAAGCGSRDELLSQSRTNCTALVLATVDIKGLSETIQQSLDCFLPAIVLKAAGMRLYLFLLLYLGLTGYLIAQTTPKPPATGRSGSDKASEEAVILE